METIYPRFFKVPSTNYFLFGPRGTGKSTLLKLLYPEALVVDLLLPDVYRKYLARPERLIELIRGNPDKKTIIVDEVQKVPEILSVVHSLIEQDKTLQFILTGSSARKLRRGGVDLLAGRVLLRTLHPFMLAEIPNRIPFDEVIKHGLLPIVIDSPNPFDVLETYIALYIREEVQIESQIRNISNFSRFLESISFSNGSVLNVSNIARECQIERKVVEGYVKILEDILLAFRLPVFSRRVQRKLVVHPKFYFFDTGIYTTLRPTGALDRPEEVAGIALEGLVAQHLMAWKAYRGNDFELSYWRSLDGMEVDFILYGAEAFFAIEVKNTGRVRPEDLRGLSAFLRDYPDSQAIFLYRGTEKLHIKNILCLPCEDFLKNLRPDVLLPIN